MKKLLFPLIILTIVAGLVGIFLIGNKPTPTAPKAPPIGETHPNLGQKHIPDGSAHDPYNSDLPSSGPHYAKPAAWGISDKEIPDETLIHNMEHGGIVIAYRPDLAAEQITKLKSLVMGLGESSQFKEVKAVLVPRSANTKSIELGAWTYTLNLDSLDEAKITDFYNGHLDKGPELVP